MWIHTGVHDSCKVGVVQMSDAGRVRAVQQTLTLFGLRFQVKLHTVGSWIWDVRAEQWCGN